MELRDLAIDRFRDFRDVYQQVFDELLVLHGNAFDMDDLTWLVERNKPHNGAQTFLLKYRKKLLLTYELDPITCQSRLVWASSLRRH